MNAKDRHYAQLADDVEGRSTDHEIRSKYANELYVSEGAFGRAWVRFNPAVPLVWVDDAEGHPRALTPKQYMVLTAALDMAEGIGITMRALAIKLEVAPSTISRALTKLAAWGLIAYFVGRGRFAGLVIFRRAPNDGFDRMRKVAKARVQRWSQAARDRLSRLKINVAPYFLERKETGTDSLYPYLESLNTVDATLTAQPFTVQDLRDVGII